MNFEMVGKLSLGNETEKFKPYSEQTYDSGWARKRIMFNAICGDNRHLLTVTALAKADETGEVFTFSKATVDDEGNHVKGEPIRIPFKDRMVQSNIDKVAEFKKFIIDLEKPNRRRDLQSAIDRVKDGKSLTDEELEKLGVSSEDELNDALKKSQKKRHEFISEWDYVDFLKKLLDSDKHKDTLFYIRGNGEYQYSAQNEKVYESYIPNRIYLAEDGKEPSSTATINILYNKDSLDAMSVDEKGKYYVNGYMMEYDSGRRGNIPVPVTITIPAAPDDAVEKEKKKVEVTKRKFVVEDDSWKELGVVVKMLNGAQKIEITDDMLTDEQKEDLECGLITLDDIRADLGGSVYGDRIREYQFYKIGRGFTKGRNDTVYSDDDMVIKPLDDGEEDLFEQENVSSSDDDDDEL